MFPFVSSVHESTHRSSDMIELGLSTKRENGRMPRSVLSTVRKMRFLESIALSRHMCSIHPCSILRNMIREDKATLVTDTIIFLGLTALFSPTPSLSLSFFVQVLCSFVSTFLHNILIKCMLSIYLSPCSYSYVYLSSANKVLLRTTATAYMFKFVLNHHYVVSQLGPLMAN